MLSPKSPGLSLNEENVEAQLDRLNDVIARTLEEAKRVTTGEDHSELPHIDDSALNISNYDVNLSDVMYTEHGLLTESYEAEVQEYVEGLELVTERVLMRMEDLEAHLGGTRERVIEVEVAPNQIIELLREVETLQNAHRCVLHLGSYTINASYSGDTTANYLRASSEDEVSELQLACRILTDQRKQLEEREQTMVRTEMELKAEVAEIRAKMVEMQHEKQQMEEEHERLISATKRQNNEALTLKEKIEELLLVQEESTSDLSSIYASEMPSVSIAHLQFENEVEALRKQVRVLGLEGSEGAIIKKEMELIEDILVGVVNGDDPRKLFLQMTVIKNRLVQHQGKQVIRDAEKMAVSIKSTLNALEHGRELQKSKNRIREEVIRRLSTPQMTPFRSPTRTPKPVIVTMECVVSPIGSPQTSHRQEFDLSIIDPKKTPKSQNYGVSERKQQELGQERVQKLLAHVRELQNKVDKYRIMEKRMIEGIARNKIFEKRLHLYKETFEAREKAVEEREMEVAKEQDALRQSASMNLSMREARDFLVFSSQNLAEKQARLIHEETKLDIERTSVRAMREEAAEVRKAVDKERRRIQREQLRLEKERKKLLESRNELEDYVQRFNLSEFLAL